MEAAALLKRFDRFVGNDSGLFLPERQIGCRRLFVYRPYLRQKSGSDFSFQ